MDKSSYDIFENLILTTISPYMVFGFVIVTNALYLYIS